MYFLMLHTTNTTQTLILRMNINRSFMSIFEVRILSRQIFEIDEVITDASLSTGTWYTNESTTH